MLKTMKDLFVKNTITVTGTVVGVHQKLFSVSLLVQTAEKLITVSLSEEGQTPLEGEHISLIYRTISVKGVPVWKKFTCWQRTHQNNPFSHNVKATKFVGFTPLA